MGGGLFSLRFFVARCVSSGIDDGRHQLAHSPTAKSLARHFTANSHLSTMPRRSGRSAPDVSASPFIARHPAFLTGALIVVAALVAYLPALSAGFIWDDTGHVTRADLRSLDGLFRIWFEIGATQQYYPLLHSAFWLQHQLWGDAPFGYHLLNVLLHAANACLFAALLRRLAIPGAAFAALLFALHPVCVESVAWISEQKNTLSTLLYLAAALAYLKFHDTRRDSVESKNQNPKLKTYWIATALFLAALLTKTVTATLPAALLVVLWWRHGRLEFRRDAVPLLPWFALGAVAGLFTAHFERELIGAQGEAFALSFVERFLLAGRVAWFYLGNLLWPANLTFIYPRWTIDATIAWQWLFPLATLALLAAAFYVAKRPVVFAFPWSRGTRAAPSGRGHRSVLAALLLFGGTLFPVLGFFNVYPFLFSYVADHFQYLASLALFALAGAVLAHVSAPLPAAARTTVAAALLAVLASLTFAQSRTYRDELTLWQTTLARNPSAWMAHNNLALILTQRERIPDAIDHLQAALALRPDYPQALSNLGDNLTRLGRPRDALPYLERALALQPNFADAHNNLGTAFTRLDRYDDAIASFKTALAHEPQLAVAHRNLGFAIANTGRHAEAIPHFQRAAQLDPRDPDAELNWAVALTLTDRFAQAIPHFERAIALSPHLPNLHLTYARVLVAQGRLAAAVPHFRATLDLAPNLPDAHRELALALRRLGRIDEAQHHFLRAEQLK